MLASVLALVDDFEVDALAAALAAVLVSTIDEMDMDTLRMDGARRVLSGVTSIEEVLRVTQADVV